MGVHQGFAQHLQAAANPQHEPARRRVPLHGPVQALLTQPGQIGAGVLAAGQDDPVGIDQLGGGSGPHQPQARHVFQGLELVQVADARIGNHGHGGVNGPGPQGAVVEHTVFLGQTVPPQHGQGGHGGHARERGQPFGAGRQQGGIATEFVEHEPSDEALLLGRQQSPGAVEMGEGAAAVDVGDQQAARARMPRHPHVDDIAGVQVDLGRGASPFDHDEVVGGPQFVERLADVGPDPLTASAPRHGAELAVGLPQQDDLAAGIGLGLEEDGVHAHIGPHAGREGLEVLGAADFAPATVGAGHDAGVVAHVLRLERGDLEALAREVAAQGGGQPAFARAAGGA